MRAAAAAVYAVAPAATASVAQGRLDVVAVHILLPLVIAGVAGVLAHSCDLGRRKRRLAGGQHDAVEVTPREHGGSLGDVVALADELELGVCGELLA